MCGICGFVSLEKVSYAMLERMNDSMTHRGPNDSGTEIFYGGDGYDIGLAQRRLSILDLSSQGHQPMHSDDNSVIIVFNGEIYNFLELRKEIGDYPFRSKCDTETIIASYLKWGRKNVDKWIEKLDGMFAFALFDKQKKTLYLVRDRVGKKTLYYWLYKNNIVFASELKPLMLHPDFKESINKKIIPRYLFQQYINAPDTIFENVYQLEPGCVLAFRKGQLCVKKYWDIYREYMNGSQESISDYNEAKETLRSLLKKAVSKRMIADVPLGTFLSGGYDSSLITALAQECSDVPINTFSIGVYDNNYDEAKYARQISDYLGTNHTETYLDDRMLFEMISDIPKYFDQPFADVSQIPTMLVSKTAKEKVTVALSGDGGDELFCGYSIYDTVRLAEKFDGIGELLYWIGKIGIGNRHVIEFYPAKVAAVAENRDLRFKTQVRPSAYMETINRMMLLEDDYHEPRYDMETKYSKKSWQIKRMLLDMETYLPGDILTKVDRASMKYSLESRCPILDCDVVCYSFQIPHKFKYHHKDKKHIFKDIAHDYIPKELLDRPKQGFGVPVDKWLLGKLRSEVKKYADEKFLKRQEIFEPKYVNKLINWYLRTGDHGLGTGNNYSRIIWPFFVFQQWYEYYICK